MYRIRTSINSSKNASEFKKAHENKNVPVGISAYMTADPSFEYPVGIQSNNAIRGLCPLNVKITIEIFWIYWE